MNYLLDRKKKKNKYPKIILGLVILLFVIYFQANIFSGLGKMVHTIFRPVLVVGNNVKEKFSNDSSVFLSKKSLMIENENLKSQLVEKEASLVNYNGIVEDNAKLKEILDRKNEASNMILGAILSKPNSSPYDTLIIDAGTEQGVAVGDKVFALGNVPIGRVAEVYARTSKVILFSNPGEKTEVAVGGTDVFMQMVGRGGGNFEMNLPRDLTLTKGAEAHLPGITPYVVGTVATIISDPRDAFTKALLVAPVNIQELKFVQILKN